MKYQIFTVQLPKIGKKEDILSSEIFLIDETIDCIVIHLILIFVDRVKLFSIIYSDVFTNV